MTYKKSHIKFTFIPWMLTALFFLLGLTAVLAEGSKDLYPANAQGGRAYLRASNTSSAVFPYPNLATHYVYAEAGEQIALASSAQTGNTDRIRLYDPNNTQLTLSFSWGDGNIPNRTGELAGPRLPGQGSGNNRYAPIYHQVTETGIYKVEFISTSNSETGNNRIGYVAANANWSQSNNSHYLAAWDISVAKQTGNTWSWQNGRVYTTVVNMDNPSYGGTFGNDNNNFRPNSGFYGVFNVLTRDGYVYNVDNNGSQGISFTFMVNNRGFHEPGTPDVPLYKSIQAPSEQYVRNRYHDPRIEDSGAAVTQKIFYNHPDSSMPETSYGAVPGGQTWLRIPEKDLNVNEITVSGVEGVENQLGNKGAYIEFYNESGGDYFITIRPKPNSSTNFPERSLTGSSIIGDNKILWDGKDGDGASLPQGLADVEVELKLRGAEVHFPYIDMELNHHGIILELLTEDLNSVRSDKVFWDDTDIRTVNTNIYGSMTSPRNASHEVFPDGTSSTTNGHIWGLGSTRTVGTFGDDQGMDTWTFIEGDALTEEFEVTVKIADLEIPSITPNKTQLTAVGEEITYSIKAKNNGPSDVEEAPFSFIIPEGFDPENITFNDVDNCGVEFDALTYDANTRTYNSILSLPNGCEVEYEITLKTNANIVVDNHEFTATIMRSNDVTDPDATNQDPQVPPTDPFFECSDNGQSGDCNNIKTNSINFSISTDHCITGCNDNTFLNSTDPNTIGYDNIVGLYHSTMLQETNGDLLVWGASSKPDGDHQLSPTVVSPANGYNYQGEILKHTGGAANGSNAQFAILTTEGLYIWGKAGYLIHHNVKSGDTFEKANALGTAGISGTNSYSLPIGVMPEDVKMMFGTYLTLAIVTCTGEAWVLSLNEDLYGDGETSSSSSHKSVWHRVSTASNTPLENVVAIRGSTTALIALTSDGEIFTWGKNTYLGDGSSKSKRTYAVQMNKPSGTVKQIGMTGGNSYYVLNTNGELYSLGNNSDRELGDFSTTERKSWVRVQRDGSGAPLPEIAWVSPNEHSARSSESGYGAVNALTTDGKLWSWGRNSYNMIGAGGSRIDPTLMTGDLDPNDRIMAVETGGHTTMVIRQCSFKYGYIGHKTRGSMGDGTSSSGQEDVFNFEDTADVSLCGAPTAPLVQDVLTMCEGFTTDLSYATLENAPLGMEVKWYEDLARQNEVSDPTSVDPGTYYAFYIPIDNSSCEEPAGVEVLVRYLEPGDPGFEDCEPEIICTESIDGEPFSWTYADGQKPDGSTVSETITQPGTNAGFVFDIYELDNSFNMEINGDKLANQELEFQAGVSAGPQNIRFVDGMIWEEGGIDDIWKLEGEPGKPIIRVEILSSGEILMFGSKVSSSNPNYALEPLELFNGNTFNTITWNTDSNDPLNNEIIVTQNVVGATKMVGYGSGQNIVPCKTYTLEKDGVFNDENSDGIAQVGETITYTFTVKNAGDIDIHNLVLEDPLLGGVINEPLTGDDNNDGVLNTYEEWVYTVNYTITQVDIDNKGVYNQAIVSGDNELNIPQDPETSTDPTPLDPNDPMYDPEREDHTFVPLKGRSLLITNPNIYQKVKGN